MSDEQDDPQQAFGLPAAALHRIGTYDPSKPIVMTNIMKDQKGHGHPIILLLANEQFLKYLDTVITIAEIAEGSAEQRAKVTYIRRQHTIIKGALRS